MIGPTDFADLSINHETRFMSQPTVQILILPSTVLRRNFANRLFSLKTHQMFCDHTLPEEFENTSYSNWRLRKTRAGKSRDYRDVIVFEKLRFQNVFRPH